MPSIVENLNRWEVEYDWDEGGAPWSRPWGGVSAQWYGSVLPRIHHFLPAQRILEIAPGFGRWTQFLIDHCDSLIGIDLAPKCVEACRQRFGQRSGVTFDTNDGRSLPMVDDSSIDFAFSYDSLVHVESETLAAYLSELARVLKPEGAAFLHHSNYGSYQRSARALEPLQGAFDHMPEVIRAGLLRTGIYRGAHMRAASVTADSFAELCRQAGLKCVGQELVNWEGGVLLLDCLSVVAHPGSRWDRPIRRVSNRLFRIEARALRRSQKAYC